MVVRYIKSLIKGEKFVIASEGDLAKYITAATTYSSSNESVATVGNEVDTETGTTTYGVINGVGCGKAIITAMLNEDDGVELNINVIGIDIDYRKSGADSNNVINFEDETEIEFSAVTPNHIIRSKFIDNNGNEVTVDGLEVIQPSDTTVIVKATSNSVTTGKIRLELINRHSEYVGLTEDLNSVDQYTNIYGDRITKTYTETEVTKGVKIWDSTNKCYRYVETDTVPGSNPPQKFTEKTPLDPIKFYQSVYNIDVTVKGIKLPDNVVLGFASNNTYSIKKLNSTSNNIGTITIDSPNVNTDSVRLELFPMDLQFRANDQKNAFLFDLNLAIPYTYKLKSIYKDIITNYNINVIGDRIILSNRPVLVNESTRERVYEVNVGEVSAIEFYSNPCRDRNYITYEVRDEEGNDITDTDVNNKDEKDKTLAVDLFYIGTVQLARFNKLGTYTIVAKWNNGQGKSSSIKVLPESEIKVTVVKPADEETPNYGVPEESGNGQQQSTGDNNNNSGEAGAESGSVSNGGSELPNE